MGQKQQQHGKLQNQVTIWNIAEFLMEVISLKWKLLP